MSTSILYISSMQMILTPACRSGKFLNGDNLMGPFLQISPIDIALKGLKRRTLLSNSTLAAQLFCEDLFTWTTLSCIMTWLRPDTAVKRERITLRNSHSKKKKTPTEPLNVTGNSEKDGLLLTAWIGGTYMFWCQMMASQKPVGEFRSSALQTCRNSFWMCSTVNGDTRAAVARVTAGRRSVSCCCCFDSFTPAAQLRPCLSASSPRPKVPKIEAFV